MPVDAALERLDSGTGTTLTVIPSPVELVVEARRSALSDPFAYLAPFETNRMGTHELYLWVSAPQSGEPIDVPQVFCGDKLVALETLDAGMTDIGLSKPPYAEPAPWSAQWYFRLPGEALDCLVSASQIEVVTRAGGAEPDRYSAQAPALVELARFVARIRG